MSKEEIPWDKVAKEVVKVLGIETAKGLWYGFSIQTLYPLLADIVKRTVAGGARSEDELRRIVQEELRKAQTPSPTPEDLERRIAQMMKQIAESPTTTTTPPSAWPPVQRAPTDVEFEMEQIRNRLNTLENTRNQLISKKYTTFDETEKRKIEDSIREIDLEIEREKTRLASIRSMYRI
ncbi:MAG: hypothetical protein QXR44_04155 [Thermoproteota archaeon]|nr:hypothetical protein [Thermoproteota archaeon]